VAPLGADQRGTVGESTDVGDGSIQPVTADNPVPWRIRITGSERPNLRSPDPAAVRSSGGRRRQANQANQTGREAMTQQATRCGPVVAVRGGRVGTPLRMGAGFNESCPRSLKSAANPRSGYSLQEVVVVAEVDASAGGRSSAGLGSRRIGQRPANAVGR